MHTAMPEDAFFCDKRFPFPAFMQGLQKNSAATSIRGRCTIGPQYICITVFRVCSNSLTLWVLAPLNMIDSDDRQRHAARIGQYAALGPHFSPGRWDFHDRFCLTDY
jgi:hypothetical protein